MQELRKSLDERHGCVKKKLDRSREASRERFNTKSRMNPIKLAVGDYCLLRTMHRRPTSKLEHLWTGPFLVSKCLSEHSYVVRNLLTQQDFRVHASLLIFFDGALDTTCAVALEKHLAHSLFNFTSAEIVSYKRTSSGFLLAIRKEGLPISGEDAEDAIEFIPLPVVAKYLPNTTRQYIDTLKGDSNTAGIARSMERELGRTN